MTYARGEWSSLLRAVLLANLTQREERTIKLLKINRVRILSIQTGISSIRPKKVSFLIIEFRGNQFLYKVQSLIKFRLGHKIVSQVHQISCQNSKRSLFVQKMKIFMQWALVKNVTGRANHINTWSQPCLKCVKWFLSPKIRFSSFRLKEMLTTPIVSPNWKLVLFYLTNRTSNWIKCSKKVKKNEWKKGDIKININGWLVKKQSMKRFC